MNEYMRRYATIALLAMILVAAAANMFLIWRVLTALEGDDACRVPKGTPVCRSVPISFVHSYPECTNRLLESLNITNVRIMGSDSASAVDE